MVALDQRLFLGVGVRRAPMFEIRPADCRQRFLAAHVGAVER
jgi:hypothetical protein